MHIDIQAHGFLLTDSLRIRAEQRIRSPLAYCSRRIERVVLRLYDIGGPRYGADKCCDLHVKLPSLPDVVVKEVEADLYVAIDRAAKRAGRILWLRLALQVRRGRSAGFARHGIGYR